MPQKVLVVVQNPTSTPGRVGRMLVDMGFSLDIRCPGANEQLPETMEQHNAAAIFGGEMSANDSESFLFIRRQLEWILMILDSGKPLLGVCLGAQLLARSLGAAVMPHPEGKCEIGYYPIRPTPAGREYFRGPLHVYHWHHERFELPHGADLLAEGEIFPNQAFRFGRTAFGLQFHPEITGDVVTRWATTGEAKLSAPGAQSREQQLQNISLHDPAIDAWLKEFLDAWLDSRVPEPQA